jgi:anti-sigma B factor antagonist
MVENQSINALSLSSLDGDATFATGESDGNAPTSMVPDGLPRLVVRDVDGFAVVDFVNAEVLFEGGVIRELSTQLHHLIEQGHTRLLLNLGGIRLMSGGMLATLVGLHRRVERAQGRLGLFGLDAVLRDMVRICRLERVFDIYADESEALSGRSAADNRPQFERSRPLCHGVDVAPDMLS